ncbi:hypothetical protein E2C01_007764 [Portunus trituberculatus]|uniref:Uncharacterized protein n=1 Tax=Portunus trituberculatus TaxID=210409 RepID=A0A5B7D0Z8_PORTR|nr:hypothetical protein [Portunus trituberculatus]
MPKCSTYHTTGSGHPRTQRVSRVMVWEIILRRGLHLACPWALHARDMLHRLVLPHVTHVAHCCGT